MSAFVTFEMGGFFAPGQADLQSFFNFQALFYVLLAPALAMRLWAEERNSGTIELLLTLPITTFDAVLGKFIAAWIFSGLALALTFPLWLTVNYLGSPDNGVIAASYSGSWLMAGAFLALGSCMAALTRNQVIAFVLTITLCLLFVLLGMPPVLKFFYAWLPADMTDLVANLSFMTHFQAISRGVLDLRDLLFFAGFIAIWLLATKIIIDLKKSH
jgi:ABC-2 type transport system permease protein|tara:strand:- start:385 stop:1029 length:645 start_codon:yes stop_codon:yes gene_type:complete